jgi:hypothetical protein
MATNNLSMTGVLRAFVEAANPDEGRRIADELRALICETLEAQPARVEQYWKIPEWFEVLIELRGVGTIESSWPQAEMLCSKWHLSKMPYELNAVWSPEIEGEAVHPKVRWLSVSFFQR